MANSTEEAVMNDGLTRDEYDALEQIGKGTHGRVSACVARNTKRLTGLKFIAYEKNGGLSLTEKGQQTLFIRSCIDGLRAIASDPGSKLAADVALFLGKKGHISPRPAGDGFDITDKGRESLADIDSAAS
ncbi:MAG: hypothetical protein WBD81_03590 [Collimonas pratensis]|uniref:hypothetical protein n=1 Tax=Collimonas pratensis TaxID=279113 RepID=UPI003C763B73